MSHWVTNATVDVEDRRFYEHGGIDWEGVVRAAVENVKSGHIVQGGSTITQQYTKNAYLTSERSWKRKLKELVLSIKLETSSSKDEILENYLNTVYFGRGAYGVQAGARAYFGKDIALLNTKEAAFLAALLKSPEGFAPEVNLERLQDRWKYVIGQMREAGWMSADAYDKAEFPSFKPRRSGNRLSGPPGYILAEVKKFLNTLGYDDASLGVAGLTIYTTIDKDAQDAAVGAVKSEGPKSNTEGLRIGLAAVRPGKIGRASCRERVSSPV